MKTPREYLASIGARGGKKSRRKLTKKQAREMVKARERKRAAGVALKPRGHDGARSTTDPSSPTREDKHGRH
jgi:hypothetical protein